MFLSFRIIALLSLFFLTATAGIASGGKGRSMVHKLVVDGDERSYIVYKPAGTDSRNLPLMIVLHGGLGNAEHMEEMTGMDEVADSGKFVVAYPDGTGGRFGAMKDRRTWNAGRCCGRAVKQNVDDVSFMKKMIKDIASRYSIDTRRVYVTGMSNGAMLAYRLACEVPDMIAAIVPVSGTLAVDNCDGAKDIPVLHIHGDQDNNVPFLGGKGESGVSGVAHRSVDDTLKLVLRPRHCGEPKQKTLPGDIYVSSYHCKNGAPVELYVIRGGEHVWPGGHGRNNKPSDGKYIQASKLAWEFAKEFSKKR